MKTILLIGALFVAVLNAVEICPCQRDYVPVCGSDGKTYGNLCEFRCAAKTRSNLKLVKKSSCEPEPYGTVNSAVAEEICPCPRNYMPVCASNGRTYNNMCQFECEAKKNTNLRLMARSSCEKQVYA